MQTDITRLQSQVLPNIFPDGFMSSARILLLINFFLFALLGCQEKQTRQPYGYVERLDPGLDLVLDSAAKGEILGDGFEWSEGPLWVESEKMLLFSDIPSNAIFKWTEAAGIEPYLSPSGFTGENFKGREPGSNGLLLNAEGKLVMCQHGDRRMAVMNSAVTDPKPEFLTLADRYQGKRFNSPNDAIFDRAGNLFFTDPPYGLPGNVEDPEKELLFQGVYKLKPDGTVILLVDSLTRPNGIGFSPDEKTLYVANSEGEAARWYAFDVDGDSLKNARIFYQTPFVDGQKGAPDGLKVDRHGNIFATGPGGIWILDPSAKVLGRIRLPEATANCALSADGKFLYLTSDMYLARIALK
jgi:gluconolactonase